MTFNEKKALIIVNPVAGKKRAKTAVYNVVSALSANSFSPTIHITSCAGDAKEYVTQFGGGYDRIIAMGGDGTLSEVISGIMLNGRTDTEVGYIPCGTTNDFAKTLGLTANMTLSAKTAAAGLPFTTDIGRFGEDVYFTYVASFGIFTSSSYSTPQNAKNAFGSLAYIVSGLVEFADSGNAKSYKVRVEYDEGNVIEDSFIFGSVTNSKSVAGLVKLPNDFVNLCDGVFEVFLVRKPKNNFEFNQLFNAVTSKKFNSPLIEKFRSSQLKIHCKDSIPWTVDGEFAGAVNDVEINNMHGAITIMCSEKKKDVLEEMQNSPALPIDIE